MKKIITHIFIALSLLTSFSSIAAEVDDLKGKTIKFNFYADLSSAKYEKHYINMERPRNWKFDFIENSCFVTGDSILLGEVWKITAIEPIKGFDELKRVYLELGEKRVKMRCSSEGISYGGIEKLKLTKKVLLSVFKNKIEISD